ncbi:mycothiol synthase [Gordonia rubripertincta]|uniref:Mycothiol acetyltransferase n=1 Tax=Gordonia rubripertincta TaxID=36822 RepID=A0ABT4N1Q2_GORRU|nr:mycothiol synthase [Gordonia rubripertincta]MCZ4553199.1 mycothiol synthase [Gordonia rubripertincta]
MGVESTQRVRDIVAAATLADRVAPLGEQAVAAIGRPGIAEFTVSSGDDVVGYANVQPSRDGEPAMIELVVDPEHRQQGHGKRLLTTVLGQVEGDRRIWAHGDLPAASALAEDMGLAPLRELLQLRRPLTDPLPDLLVPDDLVLRTYAGPTDDPEILRVNNAAFAWHPEQGGWSAEQIDERTGSDWFDAAGVFLAFDAADPDRLLGFHWTKVHPAEGDTAELGEVYIVGVDPAAQGRGLGRILTLAGLHHLRDLGLGEVELYVEGDNTAALNTYNKLGFTRYAIDVAYG